MLAEGLCFKGSWDGSLMWEQSLVSRSGCRQEHVLASARGQHKGPGVHAGSCLWGICAQEQCPDRTGPGRVLWEVAGSPGGNTQHRWPQGCVLVDGCVHRRVRAGGRVSAGCSGASLLSPRHRAFTPSAPGPYSEPPPTPPRRHRLWCRYSCARAAGTCGLLFPPPFSLTPCSCQLSASWNKHPASPPANEAIRGLSG